MGDEPKSKKCYVVVHHHDLHYDYYPEIVSYLMKAFLDKSDADKFAEQLANDLTIQKPVYPFKWDDQYKYWMNYCDMIEVEEVDFDDGAC
jgi:hypothetical protein